MGQRVGSVGQRHVEGVVGLVHIGGVSGVVELAGQVIQLLQGVLCGDAILLLHHIIGSDEDGEALVLVIGHTGHLFPEVGGVGVLGIAVGIIVLVLDKLQRVHQARCLQGLGEIAHAGVVLHNLSHRTVGVLQHLADRLYDTVLHGVVLGGEIDFRHTVEPNLGVAVLICVMRNLDITLVHVGRMQRTVDHLDGGVHVVHQVRAGDGVTLGVCQVFHRLDSALLVEGLEGLVGGQEERIVSVG